MVIQMMRKKRRGHSVMKDDLAGWKLPSSDFGENAAWWWMMKIIKYFHLKFFSLFLLINISLGMPSLINASPEKQENQRVLVVNSYHPGYSWSDDIMLGIQDVLGTQRDIELIIEHLDTKRHFEKPYFRQMEELFRQKYRSSDIDLVITSDDNALDFILSIRKELFSDAPLIFCGIDHIKPKRIAGQESVYGIEEANSTSSTIKLILSIHPEIESITFITDKTSTGQLMLEKTKKLEPAFQNNVRFNYIIGVPVEELQLTLNGISENTIIFYLSFIRDQNGKVFSIEDSMKLITENANVPVYCSWGFQPDTGVIGGNVLSGYKQGEISAEIAGRLLGSDPVKGIPAIQQAPLVSKFDYKALNRFNIDKGRIPQNSIVYNKPESFYEDHTIIIWRSLSVGFSLVFLIILLFINIKRRKKTENDLQKVNERLEQNVKDRTGHLRETNRKLHLEIIEHKQTEEALKESEERFKSMMEAMSEASYICTSDFHISYMNPAMIKKIGRDAKGDVCYKTINDFNEQCPFCVFDKVKGGEICETEITNPRDGRVYLTSHSPIFHQDGSISKMTIYRDITDRKQAEKELARQNRMNLSFAEISSDLITSSKIYEICNIVLLHAIKVTGSQFGYVGYIDPATGFLVCPTMALEIWEDCQIANKQIIFKNFTGLFGWVLKEGKPLLSNDPESDPRSGGTPAGHLPIEKFLCVPALLGENVLGQIALANPGRDYIDEDLQLLSRLAPIFATVIQRWFAEEELRKAKIEADIANQSKTNFLSSMSHEIRTPLNAILGFALLMSKDQAMPAEHHEKLNIIRKSGRLLLDLINQVLDLSKIEAGRISLDENDFDFYHHLDDLNDMFNPMAEEKGLELLFECAPDAPRNFVADEMKLRQVLINLLGNAVKFTETGSVSLKVKKAEASENYPLSSQVFLHFAVEDTGPGIRPDEIENLFKAFTQTESGRKAKEGTGLGLPISQKFVQLMGDDITVSSEPGRGSAFSFCIPVRVSEPYAVETEEQYRMTKAIDTNGKFDQALRKAAVEALPVQLVSELREAATYCEVDVITRIISNIREQDSGLADKLDQLANQFDFDGILALLKEKT